MRRLRLDRELPVEQRIARCPKPDPKVEPHRRIVETSPAVAGDGARRDPESYRDLLESEREVEVALHQGEHRSVSERRVGSREAPTRCGASVGRGVWTRAFATSVASTEP